MIVLGILCVLMLRIIYFLSATILPHLINNIPLNNTSIHNPTLTHQLNSTVQTVHSIAQNLNYPSDTIHNFACKSIVLPTTLHGTTIQAYNCINPTDILIVEPFTWKLDSIINIFYKDTDKGNTLDNTIDNKPNNFVNNLFNLTTMSKTVDVILARLLEAKDAIHVEQQLRFLTTVSIDTETHAQTVINKTNNKLQEFNLINRYNFAVGRWEDKTIRIICKPVRYGRTTRYTVV